MSTATLTIPTAAKLRAEIRARAAELRALRQLLRLAEAAATAEAARKLRSQMQPVAQTQEVQHAS